MPKGKQSPRQTKNNQRDRGRRDAERRIEPPPREAQADMSRLLHEAAWARMFGKLEAKNPFAR